MDKPKYSISVTGLMDFCITPKHYHSFHIKKEREPSEAMTEGIALHLAVLEPEVFPLRVYTDMVAPEGVAVLRTVSDYRDWLKGTGEKLKSGLAKRELVDLYNQKQLLRKDGTVMREDELEQLYADKIRLTPATMSRVLRMRDSLLEHRFVNKYISNPDAQKEVRVEGVVHGVHVRGRIDWMFYNKDLDRIVIIDVKKCTNASRWQWEKTVYDRRYFIQAYLYSELVKQMFGKDTLYAYAICEGALPFCAEVYAADDGQLDAGEQLSEYQLQRFKECCDSDTWQAYSDGNIQNCSLPKYGYDSIASILEHGERI